MKIGILTFHRAYNYGAQFQAYSLSKTIEEFGNEVLFIDYRLPRIEIPYKTFSFEPYKNQSLISKAKIFISRCITLRRRYKRHKNFSVFSSTWIKRGPVVQDNVVTGSNFDCIVFGSDQIWTTRFLKKFDSIYWGDIKINCKRKISYAPSMEMSELSAEQKDFCKTHLENFQSLSVREERMISLLSPLTEKEIKVVADPVFLREKSEFLELSQKSKLNLPDKYVLVYTIGKPSDEVINIAKKVSEQIICPIIRICGEVILKNNSNCLDTAGPYDFLKAFANAKFIITTTFHGTAFSIIFEKPFFSIRNKGISGRAESILNKVGLEKNLISKKTEINNIIDYQPRYDLVKGKIEEFRNESIEYLKQSLI